MVYSLLFQHLPTHPLEDYIPKLCASRWSQTLNGSMKIYPFFLILSLSLFLSFFLCVCGGGARGTLDCSCVCTVVARHPPVSSPLELGLQAGTTTPGFYVDPNSGPPKCAFLSLSCPHSLKVLSFKSGSYVAQLGLKLNI